MAKIKASRNGTKKDAITRKAATLFRKKGFAGSPMRELAESIGVEAPSLYNHIGSKSEILQIICFRVANDFNKHLEEVQAIQQNTLAKLENIIRFHINMMINEYDTVYVANHEWKQLQDPFLSNFLVQRRTYEHTLVQIVSEGIRKQELKNIQPHVAVLTILSALRGLESWQRHKKNISETELADGMVTQLIKGLMK